jgi:DNA-binding GntR family transcriptional regulator
VSPPGDGRLEIASVVDQVYGVIRERILAGDLPRGARVHQEDVAADLGVSRTPVREALRRLAAEGLIEMRTNRGARVTDLAPDDMDQPYEARLLVEPGAARLAAQRDDRRPAPRDPGRAAHVRRQQGVPHRPRRGVG